MKKSQKSIIENLLLASADYERSTKRYPVMDMFLLADGLGDDGVYTDADARCTTRKLNNTWLHPVEVDGSDEPWKLPWASHISEVDLKEVRGLRPIFTNPVTHEPVKVLNNFVPRKAYKLKYFASGKDVKGKLSWGSSRATWFILQRGDTYYSVAPNGVVVDIRPPHVVEGGEDLPTYLQFLLGSRYGFQCFAEYRWRVALEFEQGRPPLCLHTDPETVREILAMRTMKEKEAQKRFVTIVRQHTRRVREYEEAGSPPVTASVMRHLRGRVEGLWQGCRVVVTPPVNEICSLDKVTKKVREVAEHAKPHLPQWTSKCEK